MADNLEDPFAPSPLDPAQQFSQPLGALGLGVSPQLVQSTQPTPITPPPQLAADDPKQKLLALAALGFMLGAGQKSGLAQGAARGVLTGQENLDQTNFRRYAYEQAQQQQKDRQQQEAVRAEALREDSKQRQLIAALDKIKNRVGQIPNKAQYDQEIEGYANQLRAAGYRVDGEWLRSAAPYHAPDIAQRAAQALDVWRKIPSNDNLLKTNPDALNSVALTFDKDSDGVPERVPLTQVAELAGMPFTVQNGQIIGAPKGTTKPIEANANGMLALLVQRAKNEGKDPEKDPALMSQLVAQAIKQHEALTAKPPAPEKPVDQSKLEQNYRTALLRAVSSRSGGLGLEDSKVNSANHLLALMNQYEGKPMPQNIQAELSLGLARLVSPNGQVGIELSRELNQPTAQGAFAHVVAYATGDPTLVNASPEKVRDIFRESIVRQGQTAQALRDQYMSYIRALAPTDLEEARRMQLESGMLSPLQGVEKPQTKKNYLSTDPNAGRPARSGTVKK